MQTHQYETLAVWSDWVPLATCLTQVPRLPGVYLIGLDRTPIYAGYSAERRGKGLWERLGVYLSGKGAVSGFGEAAFDRALADQSWVMDRLRRAESGGPDRAKSWAAAAVRRLPFQVCWATTADGATAKALERQVIAALRPALWNRG